MASVNLRTIYAFAREMYPKKVTANIQYGTAGFRTRYVFDNETIEFRLIGVLKAHQTPYIEIM